MGMNLRIIGRAVCEKGQSQTHSLEPVEFPLLPNGLIRHDSDGGHWSHTGDQDSVWNGKVTVAVVIPISLCQWLNQREEPRGY